MRERGYPGARAVAETVEARFERHRSRIEDQAELAPRIDARAIETIVDVAFWASLQKEESRSPRISLAFLAPEQAAQPLTFGRRLPLAPHTLTRLAPAVERPGIHLGVWKDSNGFFVWGAARAIPDLSFVVEVVEPGLLVIKYARGRAFGKFGNVAVLQGDEIQVVDEAGVRRPDRPAMLASLVGFDAPVAALDATNVLVHLAASMRAHGHGGALLFVPDGTDRWKESIVSPISYVVIPPLARLATLVKADFDERNSPEWLQATHLAIDAIGGLTAVDGVTIIKESYEVLAFGAKIQRARQSTPVEKILLTQPVEGNLAEVVEPAVVGGTRHLSAAQFVHDQRDALAFVASQDRRFTLFAWSAEDEMVHAHRVEALLL